MNIALRLLAASILAINTGGCALVIPSSDPTPPSTVMTVVRSVGSNTVEQMYLTSTSAPVLRQVGPDETIQLAASATDKDGGVSNVSISGEVNIECDIGGGLTQLHTFFFYRGNPDTGKGPGDTASDTRLTSFDITISELRKECGPQSTFVRLWTSSSNLFSAVGENYFGGTDTTTTFGFAQP